MNKRSSIQMAHHHKKKVSPNLKPPAKAQRNWYQED